MPKMLPVILRNFFNPRATRSYPLEVRRPFPETRGELINDINTCIFCSTCAHKCPSQCIEVSKQEATWKYDPFACVYCGVCHDICPTHSLSFKGKYRKPTSAQVLVSLKGEIKKKKEKNKPEESSMTPVPEE